MPIEAKILCDSLNVEYDRTIRLTTFQLRMPTCLIAEFNTHRMISKSVGSTRAKPTKAVIKDIMNDPFIPHVWQSNQPGMVGKDDDLNSYVIDPLYKRKRTREYMWLDAMNRSIDIALAFDDAGYHKQIQGRLLTPFSYSDVVATATDWENFFHLRDHKDAEPHMQLLAKLMINAIEKSEPTEVYYGDWHLPYITEEEKEKYDVGLLKQVSTARCARVSYNAHDGTKTSIEDDQKLYARLMLMEPEHASPAEHIAKASDPTRGNAEFFGNFFGFEQFRKIEHEKWIRRSNDYKKRSYKG